MPPTGLKNEPTPLTSQVNTQTVSNTIYAVYNWLDVSLHWVIFTTAYAALVQMGSNDQPGGCSNHGQGNCIIHFIYPNPVVDKTVVLLFTNMDKGIYQSGLLNNGGGTVTETTVNHGGGNGLQKINLPNGLTAGSYKLEVIIPGTNRSAISVMVLQ